MSLPQYGLDRRITVRMLLGHTSGLLDYTDGLSDTTLPGAAPITVGNAAIDPAQVFPQELDKLFKAVFCGA